MNLVRRTLLFRTGLVFAALALQNGCQRNPPIESWDSPRMLEIKKQWDALEQTRTQSVHVYEDLQKAMDSLLARQLSDEDVRQLVASCERLRVREKERSDFENAVLKFIVRVLAESGDRECLVKLLSTRCPNHIYLHESIEFYLPFRGYKLKDPILVLGEAYAECQVPEVRHDLAVVVRRGFTNLGIRGKDDADFVSNAMQWYEKEKEHLVLNDRYWMDDTELPSEWYERSSELYEELPKGHRRALLFTRKPAGE
jgi:hypothetical protein